MVLWIGGTNAQVYCIWKKLLIWDQRNWKSLYDHGERWDYLNLIFIELSSKKNRNAYLLLPNSTDRDCIHDQEIIHPIYCKLDMFKYFRTSWRYWQNLILFWTCAKHGCLFHPLISFDVAYTGSHHAYIVANGNLISHSLLSVFADIKHLKGWVRFKEWWKAM